MTIVFYFVLFIFFSSQICMASGCVNPSSGTVQITNSASDSFAINLSAQTITPIANLTIFSLTPNGNVCRFTVTSATGNVAIASNFNGMTFSSLNLPVRNSNRDSSGFGSLGSSINTISFRINQLSGNNLSIQTAAGVQIKRGATGTTNFYFGTSTTSTTLTASPTNESSLTATGNPFATIPLTLTAIGG